MELIEVGEIASVLRVSPRVLEADVKELCWLWEEAVEYSHGTTAAFCILRAIVQAYLRGRGRRMGNWQGLLRHQPLSVAMKHLVIRRAAEDSVFDRLHALGVTSYREFIQRIWREQGEKVGRNKEYDILDEVKQFLKEGGEP